MKPSGAVVIKAPGNTASVTLLDLFFGSEDGSSVNSMRANGFARAFLAPQPGPNSHEFLLSATTSLASSAASCQLLDPKP